MEGPFEAFVDLFENAFVCFCVARANAAGKQKVTVASFTASGLKVLGRGCARGGGTAAAEACVYDRVCRVAR